MKVFRARTEPPTPLDPAAVTEDEEPKSEKLPVADLGTDVRGHKNRKDPALEARVVRKIDLRLFPLVMTLCA